MSHRKFHHPRRGNMKYWPRGKTRQKRGKIRSFPVENPSDTPHLTAFLGFKAGCTHILRRLDKIGSKAHDKDIVEQVTIIECPPLRGVGYAGYIKTATGNRKLTEVYAPSVTEGFKRRYYKHYAASLKRAFTRYTDQFANVPQEKLPESVQNRENFLREKADTIRLIAHTQVEKISQIKMKRDDIIEIQINGGSIADKIEFCKSLLEQPIPVNTVFKKDDYADTIAVTRGKGWQNVVHRFGVNKLPRETRRGYRKVACIGAWHPAKVEWTIPRGGQMGASHRTEFNKKVYRVGEAAEFDEEGNCTKYNAITEHDLTKKNITPMGSFVRYGTVKNEYLMIKGSVGGVRKGLVTLRKALAIPSISQAREATQLKFIDTSSKFGHGRFQTSQEKRDWFGPTKKMRLKKQEKERLLSNLQQKKTRIVS